MEDLRKSLSRVSQIFQFVIKLNREIGVLTTKVEYLKTFIDKQQLPQRMEKVDKYTGMIGFPYWAAKRMVEKGVIERKGILTFYIDEFGHKRYEEY